MICNDILEAVGNTPLIKLNKLTAGLGADIYAKVEYFNPGGSIKDRVAVNIIKQAEKEGLINADTTIIEATAGNTGMGLALAAATRGYKCIFVMPDKMSCDKINLLEALGAKVVITPTNVAPDSEYSYNSVADKLSKKIRDSFRPNQFLNMNNPQAHYNSTGPEIFKDTEGLIDVLVVGVGTGGTITGAGGYLKEKKPSLKIVVADPQGSILSGGKAGCWKVEGIGEDFFPDTFNKDLVDEYIKVSDQESFSITRKLAKQEGLLVGGSSGTALAAAIKYAKKVDKKEMIVVVMPDTGRNYLSKIFSDSWMSNNDFSVDDSDEI
ncbi:MAG: cysteine synthase family protein [Actinobacteria bacterium]|nr:MAG: cysteine synthase family protein [Actinomycetota bacterium]